MNLVAHFEHLYGFFMSPVTLDNMNDFPDIYRLGEKEMKNKRNNWTKSRQIASEEALTLSVAHCFDKIF